MTHPRSFDPQVAAPALRNRWYGAASTQVSQFLYRLQGLSASAWLAATEAPLSRRSSELEAVHVPLMEELAVQAARHRLYEALDSMPTVVDRVRGRVEALVAVFDGVLPEATLARMRRTARLAALALAAQPLLRPDDVARLCRPFRDLIPLAPAPTEHPTLPLRLAAG